MNRFKWLRFILTLAKKILMREPQNLYEFKNKKHLILTKL